MGDLFLLLDALLLDALLTGLILSQGLETFGYADFALRFLIDLLTNEWALNFLDLDYRALACNWDILAL